MVQFTDIKGNVLDPQPSLSEVFRDRLAHAEATLALAATAEQTQEALKLLVEVNRLMVDASVYESLEHLSRYMEPTDTAKRLINDPRDFFVLMLTQGSPYAFHLFEWVDYQANYKYRMKIWLDVRGKNGEIQECVWPNGNHIGKFHDSEVESIRISKQYMPGAKDWKHPNDRKPGDLNYKEKKNTVL